MKLAWSGDAVALPVIVKLIALIVAYPIPKTSTNVATISNILIFLTF